jgi:hypothetical protein
VISESNGQRKLRQLDADAEERTDQRDKHDPSCSPSPVSACKNGAKAERHVKQHVGDNGAAGGHLGPACKQRAQRGLDALDRALKHKGIK